MHIEVSSDGKATPKYQIVEFGGVVIVKNEVVSILLLSLLSSILNRISSLCLRRILLLLVDLLSNINQKECSRVRMKELHGFKYDVYCSFFHT